MDPKALYQLTYGLFLLTARQDGKDNGCIINTAIQTANDPTRISIAVIKKNLTCKMIENTGIFNLSTLTVQTDFALFQRFGMQSGRDKDKFDGFSETERTENGLLRLTRNANTYLSAKVVDSKDLGSHMVFFAELTAGEVLSSVPSCTYAYYQSDIKPKPQPAKKKAWVCSVCGYVYEGDEVPDDFVCPLCSHGKQDFVLVEDTAPAKQASAAAESKKWVCPVCGYVHEGPEAPGECPVCKVPGSKFIKQEENMVWAAEHVIGVAKDVPEEIKEGLRANFQGECTEVGMYLAMARAAHREGYPEIGLYWEKAAFEEAEHAAKFAELLGEVVSPSTKQNLTVRVEAENGATQGKTDLAKKAKELGLDAIHDTVHEMARDEARHGKAFAGLLKRYFGKEIAMNREKSCGAVVFTRSGGEIRYVIVQEASGAYSFPKGHVEGNETEEQTAAREIREETGLLPVFFPGFRETEEYDLSEKPGTHKQVVYFLSEFGNEPLVPQQGEIRKILLLPYAEAMPLFRHEGSRRVLVAAQAFLSGQ